MIKGHFRYSMVSDEVRARLAGSESVYDLAVRAAGHQSALTVDKLSFKLTAALPDLIETLAAEVEKENDTAAIGVCVAYLEEDAAREQRLAGKDPATLKAHGVEPYPPGTHVTANDQEWVAEPVFGVSEDRHTFIQHRAHGWCKRCGELEPAQIHKKATVRMATYDGSIPIQFGGAEFTVDHEDDRKREA